MGYSSFKELSPSPSSITAYFMSKNCGPRAVGINQNGKTLLAQPRITVPLWGTFRQDNSYKKCTWK